MSARGIVVGCLRNPRITLPFALKTTPAPGIPRYFSISLDGVDEVQRNSMNEMCILVNEKDEIIGQDTKLNCHKLRNGNLPPLHRAFSVFLFNEKKQLLLQKRSTTKVTFPSCYTNTCCSHPLFNLDECVEKDAIGIKTAAIRRISFELGIKDLFPQHLQYLTRIQYGSASNEEWGEHEIDYILFAFKDTQMELNKDEVECVHWLSREELPDFKKKVHEKKIEVTPWFKLICDNFLHQWWSNLDSLTLYHDHQNIHKF